MVGQPAMQKRATLPQTATDAELRFWFGLLLCLASLILLLVHRRRLFAH
jgi:LPXTG-motif cell wall-anchored protein